MRTTLLIVTALLTAFGCTKEPDIVDIEKMVEDVLAEMDWHPGDEDTLLSDEDASATDTTPDKDAAADADTAKDAETPADDDTLLSDD